MMQALNIRISPAPKQKASNLRMKRQQSPHPMLIHRIRIRPFVDQLSNSPKISRVGRCNEFIVSRKLDVDFVHKTAHCAVMIAN